MSGKEAAAEIMKAAVSSKAYKRLEMLFDDGSVTQLDSFMLSEGSTAEVITAYGTVNGVKVFAFSQNVAAAGGAVSAASAAKVCRLLRMAGEMGGPVVGIYDSNGARLKQGAKMLDASAAMLSASSALSGVVPQISVIAGGCMGANAMLAANADFVICCRDAQYGVSTSGKDLSSQDAQTKGNAHVISENEDEAIRTAKKLLWMLPANNLEAAPENDYSEPRELSDVIAGQVSGEMETASVIISSIADNGSFIELLDGSAKSVVTGLAAIGGKTVGMVATRFEKNGGLICNKSAGKTARFMRICDSFSIPVVSFIDAAGFESVKGGAVVAQAYSQSSAVRISVITGAAYGSAYMTMASRSCASDFTLAWENAVISPLVPETAAAIMYEGKLRGCSDPINERARLVDEYCKTDASVYEAAKQGAVDEIIAPSETRSKLISVLAALEDKRVSCVQRKHTDMWF